MSELQRCRHAAAAVEAYIEHRRPQEAAYPQEPTDAILVDLLTDLRHLADAWGLEWSDLARRSKNHWWSEIKGRKE